MGIKLDNNRVLCGELTQGGRRYGTVVYGEGYVYSFITSNYDDAELIKNYILNLRDFDDEVVVKIKEKFEHILLKVNKTSFEEVYEISLKEDENAHLNSYLSTYSGDPNDSLYVEKLLKLLDNTIFILNKQYEWDEIDYEIYEERKKSLIYHKSQVELRLNNK